MTYAECKRPITRYGPVRSATDNRARILALPFDQLECVDVVHVEVVHGVNHLSVEHFRPFVDGKSWDVGSTACASEAENQEVKLMHLKATWGQCMGIRRS